jgi:membrane protein implicated in regulation of membrane protease activity
MRRRIWMHRSVAILCTLLVYPAMRWWSDSVLFVILISLATQAYAAWSAAEGADDRSVTDRLDRIEQLLRGDDA